MQVKNITKQVAQTLDNMGFGCDSNNSLDITKAGIWDLCDALSGMDNSKFSVQEAKEEMNRRGVC